MNRSIKIKFPLVVVGSQWGDEGKGKIVDLLAENADYVVRYNGGNNAGHTVVVDGEKFKLSLLPSGVVQKKHCLIAQGAVIDPKILLDEISFFTKRKIPVKLMIDPRVHIVMPYHKALDAATEAWKGKKATGSLHLGIGYCYEDKNNRFGIRFEDLITPTSLKEKLEMFFPLKKRQIELVFGQKTDLTVDKIYQDYVVYGKKLKKYLGDVSKVVQNSFNTPAGCIGMNPPSPRLRLAKKVLFEGAHGTFLDGVFGTYPYTTAVYTIAGAVFPYVGIAPCPIFSIGIVKAYTTRVGNGPFPTEIFDKTGDDIRKIGGEFGTVSKRPRRCGWLDLPLVRTACRLSGFNYLAITKLDVLSTLFKIKVCIGYKINGKIIKEVPSMINDFYKCKPVYKEFKGWKKDILTIKKYDKLPMQTKKYLKFIEKELKVPVKIISVGAEREENILI
jgi:adenylosuccinate synthase